MQVSAGSLDLKLHFPFLTPCSPPSFPLCFPPPLLLVHVTPIGLEGPHAHSTMRCPANNGLPSAQRLTSPTRCLLNSVTHLATRSVTGGGTWDHRARLLSGDALSLQWIICQFAERSQQSSGPKMPMFQPPRCCYCVLAREGDLRGRQDKGLLISGH